MVSPQPPRSWARRVRRALGWTLALCAAGAAAITLLALGVSWGLGRAALRAQLEQRLARALNARVQIAELRGPLYPELELRGLRIERADGLSIRAERAVLRCTRACGALERRIDLESLELTGARLELPSGRKDPGDEPDRPLTPIPVRVGRAVLDGVSLRVVLALPAQGSAEPRPTELALDGALGELWITREGIRLPPQAELRMRAQDTSLAQRAITRLQVEARLRDGVLQIEPLELATDAGSLRGSARVELPSRIVLRELPQAPPVDGAAAAAQEAADATPVRVTLALQLAGVDASAWSGFPDLRSDLSGPLELRAQLQPGSGGLRELAFRTSLQGSAARAPLSALELTGSLDPAGWRLDTARASGEGLQLQGEGSGSFTVLEKLQVQGTVHDLARLRHVVLGEDWLRGAASFEARASGPFRDLDGSIELKAPRLVLGRGPAGSLSAQAHVKGRRVQIESLRFASERESLKVSGWIDLDRQIDLTLRAERFDLQRLPPALVRSGPIAGRVSGTLAARGALARPELQVDLRGEGIQAAGSPTTHLALQLATQAQEARGLLRVDLPGAEGITASFALPYLDPPVPASPLLLFRDPRAHVELAAPQIELAQVRAWMRIPIEEALGRVRIDARLDGRSDGPRLRGKGTLSQVRGSRSGTERDRIGPIDGTIEFEQIAPWHPAGPSLRVSAALTVQASQSTWPARFRGVVHHWLDWPRLDLSIDELSAREGTQQIALEGRLQALRAAPLRLRVERLDLARLPWLARPDLGGLIDAQLTAEGELLGTPQVAGALVCEQPRFQGASADRVALELGTEGDRLVGGARVEAFGTLAALARFDAPRPSATQPVASLLSDPSTRFELRSDRLDLRWLGPAMPPWLRDPQGTIRADLRATGGTLDLQLSGSLSLEDASARVPLLGRRIGPAVASGRLENDAFVLDTLRIDPKDGGHLQASGRLALGALRPRSLELRADLDDFPLSRSRAARFALAGAAQIQGPLDALDFSGALTVKNARFDAPEPGDRIWKEIKVLQTSAPDAELQEREEKASFLDGAQGRLAIAVPPDTWVRGRGAELEVTGEIELRKERHQPLRYFGELGTRRGTYQLGSRRLDVERGSLQLAGGDALDPLLDVLATAEIAEYRVEVRVSGPLSSPIIDPSSEPPLPRDDVIAMLLFGRPTAELEQDRAAALSSALAVLGTELALDDVRNGITRLLPFDSISVEAGDSGNGARLQVGRYVGEGLFLSYGRTLLGPSGEDEVQLEYRFSPMLRVQTGTSASGNTGVDLIWRLDY
jgi:autotransporter translocation and assembly factor TamB